MRIRVDGRLSVAERHRRARGFTLLEVLIALTVLALSLAAVYESFGGSNRRAQAALARQSALEVAQSVLAEQRIQPAPWPEHRTGRATPGLDWTVDLTPATITAAPDPRWTPVIVHVRVTGRGTNRRPVELRSIEWPPLDPRS